MYLTYEEYQNMGGTLEETAFNNLEFEAECKVNWYTFNRLKRETQYPEELPRLMYKLITLIQAQQSASLTGSSNADGTITAGVASQSNDGVSISYNVISASQAVELCASSIDTAIKEALTGVKNSLGRELLYRGLYPGE